MLKLIRTVILEGLGLFTIGLIFIALGIALGMGWVGFLWMFLPLGLLFIIAETVIRFRKGLHGEL